MNEFRQVMTVHTETVQTGEEHEVTVSNETVQKLVDAAPYIREWLATNRDELYSTEQVEAALCTWLSRSIEALAEDCIFHCCEGLRPYTTGRNDFELGLQRAKVIDQRRQNHVANP